MISYWIATGWILSSLLATQSPGRVQKQNVNSETHTWSGTLIDATRTTCGSEVEKAAPAGACPPGFVTRNFAIILPDGKSLKFDEGGNAKTVDALRKSKKGSKYMFNYWKTGKTSAVMKARVTGTLTSDTLNVESISVE